MIRKPTGNPPHLSAESRISHSNARQVVILGGTGLVGRMIAEIWPERLPRPLYLIHRSFPEWLGAQEFSTRRVDLDDLSDIRSAFAGARVVINLMRPDGVGHHPALLRRLMPTMKEVGVQRCVYASSIDVYSGTSASWIDENTAVCPLSPYEKEHCEAELILEGFDELAILRLGAVFGQGGRNVVKFAEEMAHAPFWKLALRRSLYGKRRMHLVSAQLAARAICHFALNVEINGKAIVLVTQDADPDNNFAFMQDCLAESFGRRSFEKVPMLPLSVLEMALRLRGLAVETAGRRFSSNKANEFGLNTNGFARELRSYAETLAIVAGKRPQ